MSLLSYVNLNKTLKAIDTLQNLLKCEICKELTTNPLCVGRCEHFCCENCASTLDGKCFKCNLPLNKADQKPDRIVSGLVDTSSNLLKIIKGESIANIFHGREAPPTPKDKKQFYNNEAKESKINKAPTPNNSAKKRKLPTDTADKKINLNSPLPNKSKIVKKDLPNTSVVSTPDVKRIKNVDMTVFGLSPGSPFLKKRNSKGETPLHAACVKGDLIKVESLLAEGANPNSKDNAGWTPLHEACSHGYKRIVELLLSHGAIIDVPGNENSTPLHEAVTNGLEDIIILLRQWGASDTARDLYGRTPRTIASLCNGVTEMHKALDTSLEEKLSRPTPCLPFYDRLVILDMLISEESKIKLDTLKTMLNLKVVQEFSSDVTHAVSDCDDNNRIIGQSAQFYMCIVSGKWILNQHWIEECLKKEGPVSPKDYEVYGYCEGNYDGVAKKARLNSELMLPGLFKGCHIYLQSQFLNTMPVKKELEMLVKAGEGILILREPNPEAISDKEATVPYHCDVNNGLDKCSHYIIYEEGFSEPQLKYDMSHIKSLPLSWLIECIAKFRLEPPKSKPL